jgi:glycosyltransferase involved in cell wall biosynthesis
MSITVIIPTYKRVEYLKRTVESLLNQDLLPNEILIVIEERDFDTKKFAYELANVNKIIKVLHSPKPSVVRSLNIGLSNANSDIICLLDDDVWVPVTWSHKIINAYKENNTLGAYGGRDYIQLEEFTNILPVEILGRFTWSGKLIGNHHCGLKKSPAHIDIIKGVNLSFRKSALKVMEIEPALESQGAEVCWEIDLCSRIKRNGYSIIYDNDNYVLHFVSPRSEDDHRTDIFSSNWPKRIYNESLITAKFQPFYQLILFSFRYFFIGSTYQPGILRLILFFSKYKPEALIIPFRNVKYILKGAIKGLSLR